MELKKQDFSVVGEFEQEIAKFFGAPYAVSVDSCTHGIELCLRYNKVYGINVPEHTYVSVPMLAKKLNIILHWKDEEWQDYYYLTHNIIDAAVLWKRDSYIPKTFMCISFQFQKHLSLGRGGVILTDDLRAYNDLKKMSYDGRIPNIPWREQDIDTIGYHYYMQIETAQLGLDKLPEAINTKPKQWKVTDWPNVSKFKVFNK